MDQDLKTYLEGMENRLAERIAGMDGRFVELENRLVEKMRGMQTELLRGFESFAASQTIRLRKLEADQSNLDTSLRGRRCSRNQAHANRTAPGKTI